MKRCEARAMIYINCCKTLIFLPKTKPKNTMQQKVIIIGAGSPAKMAIQYLIEHQLQMNIEIISTSEALQRGIDATYHEPHERALSAIEVCKQYDPKPKPSRAQSK